MASTRSMQSAYTTSTTITQSFASPSLGTSSIDHHQYSLPYQPHTTQDNVSMLNSLLADLQSVSSDRNAVRLAACCAALVETAGETRRKASTNDGSSSSGSAGGEVTPNEMFVTTLGALSSLQTAIEAKQQQGANDADGSGEYDVSSDLENTALPLLEILRRILPFAVHVSNNGGALLGELMSLVLALLMPRVE